MKKGKYHIFLISKGLDEKTREPLNTFIATDEEEAKIYLYAYIAGEKEYGKYTLHHLAEIGDHFTLKPKYYFIASGASVNGQETKADQLTLQAKREYERAKNIFEKNMTYNEKIRKIFQGRIIND